MSMDEDEIDIDLMFHLINHITFKMNEVGRKCYRIGFVDVILCQFYNLLNENLLLLLYQIIGQLCDLLKSYSDF